jgi:hypothetical protein
VHHPGQEALRCLGFGLIFAAAVNSATAGVPLQDSGLASALVNTMQQVGGSIGISVLSTITASATTSYLVAHPAGPQAQAAAATHGYTLAFAISAALLGLSAILAILMLPSRKRLEELTSEAPAVIPEPEPGVAAPAAAAQRQADSALNPAVKVMPVGLLCCSPVIDVPPPRLSRLSRLPDLHTQHHGSALFRTVSRIAFALTSERDRREGGSCTAATKRSEESDGACDGWRRIRRCAGIPGWSSAAGLPPWSSASR